MELQVKIIKVLEPIRFSGKKDPSKVFVKHSFIGETQEQYAKKVKFDVNGEELFGKMNITVGDIYSVSFDISSREWQDKWFTEIQVWKAVRIGGSQTPTPQETRPVMTDASTQASTVKQEPPQNDDLPF